MLGCTEWDNQYVEPLQTTLSVVYAPDRQLKCGDPDALTAAGRAQAFQALPQRRVMKLTFS
jgi:hypothetical protein